MNLAFIITKFVYAQTFSYILSLIIIRRRFNRYKAYIIEFNQDKLAPQMISKRQIMTVFDSPTSKELVMRMRNFFKCYVYQDPSFTVKNNVTIEKVYLKLKNYCRDKTSEVDQMLTHTNIMCVDSPADPISQICIQSLKDFNSNETNGASFLRVAAKNQWGISKKMESLDKNFIQKHLEYQNFLLFKLLGFVAYKSCVTNLLERVDFLTECEL